MERVRRIMETRAPPYFSLTGPRRCALVLPEIEVINAEDNSPLSEDNTTRVVVDPDQLRIYVHFGFTGRRKAWA